MDTCEVPSIHTESNDPCSLVLLMLACDQGLSPSRSEVPKGLDALAGRGVDAAVPVARSRGVRTLSVGSARVVPGREVVAPVARYPAGNLREGVGVSRGGKGGAVGEYRAVGRRPCRLTPMSVMPRWSRMGECRLGWSGLSRIGGGAIGGSESGRVASKVVGLRRGTGRGGLDLGSLLCGRGAAR